MMSGPTPIWRPWGRQHGGARSPYLAALLCLVVLVVSGAVGLALKQPWLFPSLGPTVMLFFSAPKLPSSRPVNALVGHFVAIIVGYACVLAFGLTGAPPAPIAGLTLPYLAAAAISVAITTLVLELVRLPHPPAGATTMIVSLGILDKPLNLLDMAGAIVLVTLAAWLLNYAVGHWRR